MQLDTSLIDMSWWNWLVIESDWLSNTSSVGRMGIVFFAATTVSSTFLFIFPE
jgi:Na+(H+)/acetate symporter ActP